MNTLNMKLLFALVACVSARVCCADANVWKGSPSGGLWSDPDNWTQPLTPTVATVYDFSALADGAVVTNTYAYSDGAKQLVIGGLTFGENQGRVTLFGDASSQTIVKSGVFKVPTGTTLVISLAHTTTPWQDYQSKIALSGAGAIVFDCDKFRGTAWDYYFADADGMRVMLGSSSAFELCGFHFYDPSSRTPSANVRLQLAADTRVASVNGLWSSSVKNFIDQGPYAFCVGYGVATESYEAMTGTGALAFEGGGTYTLRAAPRNTGGLTVGNADVRLGRSYYLPTDPTTATSGPVRVPPETVLDLANCGSLTVFCDQTLAALRGEGTWGSVNLSSNYSGVANLTVGNAASPSETVFNGRLTGLGGLTKRGAASRLILTGANTYTGKTEVAEGSLVLRRASDPADAPAVHFDFAETEDWTSAVEGRAVATTQDGVMRLGDGVSGCGVGALDFDLTAAATPFFKFRLAPDEEPVLGGNRRFTETLWFRLRDGCRGGQGDQRYLLANGSAWQSRKWIRVYLNCSTNFNFSVGPYEWELSPSNGFSANVDESDIYDDHWHHLAVTWGEGNVLSGYLDGRLLGTATIAEDLQLPENGDYALSWNDAQTRFDGSLDEVKLFRRALTADEIRAEFSHSRVVREAGDGLPMPVACWTFNDEGNPGRDSSGNGVDLAAAVGTSMTIADYPGTFGRSLAKATGLKYGASGFPSKIPTGASPFTVSCRYKFVDTWTASPLVVWGDPQTANKFFLLGTDSSERRRPMINYNLPNVSSVRASCSYTNIVHVSVGEASAANWTHLVCTYDGSTVRMYQDGQLVHEPLKDVKLNIAADKLYVGCLPEVNAVFNGSIDDVRFYGEALSAEQVRSLTRSLATEADPPVLPTNALVSVAAGATLGIEGMLPTFAALTCAGTLELGHAGVYRVGADDDLTGCLAGVGLLLVSDRDIALVDGSSFAGALVVSNAAVRVSGGLGPAVVSLLAGASLDCAGSADVTLADGAVIDVDVLQPDVPGLSTTGELSIAEKVTIRLSGKPSQGILKVAVAGRLRLPSSFDGWMVVGPDGRPFDPNSPRIRFKMHGSEIVAKVSGGLCMVVR